MMAMSLFFANPFLFLIQPKSALMVILCCPLHPQINSDADQSIRSFPTHYHSNPSHGSKCKSLPWFKAAWTSKRQTLWIIFTVHFLWIGTPLWMCIKNSKYFIQEACIFCLSEHKNSSFNFLRLSSHVIFKK